MEDAKSFEEVTCRCGKKIYDGLMKYVYQEKWKEIYDRENGMKCCKCKNSIPSDDGRIMGCDHFYCDKCIKEMMTIATKNVDPALTCLENSCGKPFDAKVLQDVDKDLYAEYKTALHL